MDPFNEVDNLILAQTAYIDFDGIVPEALSSFPPSCWNRWRRAGDSAT